MEEKKKVSTVSCLRQWAIPYKGNYIASVIFAVLGVACGIIPYFGISKIVMALIAGERTMSLYIQWALFCAAFWILNRLFHCISTTFSHGATFSVIADVRKLLTSKLARLPMGDILDTPSGTYKSIIVEKVDSIETTLAHIVPEMTSNLLIPLAIIVYLFVLDWRMALVSMITLPIGMLCMKGMRKGFEQRYGNYVKKNRILNDTAVEYINGIEVIKGFNQSAKSYEKFTHAAREAANSAIDWMRDTQVYFSIALTVVPAVLITVLPIGCLVYMTGTLSTSNFIVCIILSLGIMPPLVTAMSYSDDLAKVGTIVNEIGSVLDREELTRPDGHKDFENYDISVDHVNFSYGDKQVLFDINMQIHPDTVTALVGPSGSGKSTIAKLLASLWDVNSGQIILGEFPLSDIPLEQLNDSIAYVAQDNYLFNDTIRNNIRMGKLSATDEEVEAAAKACGCHDFILGLSSGYETIVGSAGGHLSGGERQRISIARAMLKDAPIVILDEATAFTDPENEDIIQSAIAKLVQGKTLIVVAHRLSTITDADQIVVVEKGRILATGRHDDLLEDCPLYEDMWAAHIDAKDSDVEVIA